MKSLASLADEAKSPFASFPCFFISSLAKRLHSSSARRGDFIEKTSSFDEVFSGGGRWIRTTEGIASRFTVCPLWPLGNSPMFNWSWWTDSNPRPADYKSAALPTELYQHATGLHIIANPARNVNTYFHIFFVSDGFPNRELLHKPRI